MKYRRGTRRLVRQVGAVSLLLPLAVSAWTPRLHAMPCPRTAADAREQLDRSLYAAMWTLHFRDLDRGLESNRLVGASWGSMYGATFINSFGKRAYSGGFQKTLAHVNAGIACLGAGYRVGLVTGYDRRFLRLAEKVPALPFLQPLLTLEVSRFGVELSYAGVVASAELKVRL